MARPARNPNHPLTRLRKQLSTADHQVTREELAQRTAIPIGSLKSIESGKYGITNQLAAKISLGVPVNPFDLVRGADPLRDFTGQPLTADSVPLEKLKAPFLSERTGFETDQYVEKVAFAVAEKRFLAMQFRFLLREAFAEAVESLGLTQLVAEELSEHLDKLGEFDPAQVMHQLRPRRADSRKRWEAIERLVRLEDDRLFIEKRNEDPALQITPDMSEEEKARLNWESAKLEAERWAQALANVAASMKKNRTAPRQKLAVRNPLQDNLAPERLCVLQPV